MFRYFINENNESATIKISETEEEYSIVAIKLEKKEGRIKFSVHEIKVDKQTLSTIKANINELIFTWFDIELNTDLHNYIETTENSVLKRKTFYKIIRDANIKLIRKQDIEQRI